MGPGQAGPGTKSLVGLLFAVSVTATFLQRSTGMGAADLLFDRDRVLANGEVWRIFTYAFCKSSPLSLLFSAAALWLFGASFEARMGTRGFLRFFFMSCIGAALLAIPLGVLCDATRLFVDRGVFGGPDAAIDAMLVSLALAAPTSPVLFGFVLPMPAKTFVGLLLLLELLSGIMTGVASMGLTVGGMLMGYVLTTGTWDPRTWVDRLRLWQFNRRRRRELYVVPPKRRRDLN